MQNHAAVTKFKMLWMMCRCNVLFVRLYIETQTGSNEIKILNSFASELIQSLTALALHTIENKTS